MINTTIATNKMGMERPAGVGDDRGVRAGAACGGGSLDTDFFLAMYRLPSNRLVWRPDDRGDDYPTRTLSNRLVW